MKILFVEDDIQYAQFIKDVMEHLDDPSISMIHVISLKDGICLAENRKFDVALLDLDLPDSRGLETIQRLNARNPGFPIVVLTAQKEESYAMQALSAGATDYLVKDEIVPKLLIRVLNFAMERNQAKSRLKESDDRQRAILESVQAGIFIIDPESHVIIDANPAALNMLKQSADQVVGKICHQFVCPAEEGKCPATDLNQTIEQSERELLLPGGRRIHILKTVSTIQLQGKPVLLESFFDISAIKKAQAVLERSKKELEDEVQKRIHQVQLGKKQWEATFDAVPDLITLIDNDFKIIRANRAAAKMMGLEPADMVGRRCYELFHTGGTSPKNCPHAKLLRDKKEHIESIKDMERGRDFLISTSPLLDEKEKIYASVHVMRDVTQLKKAERTARAQVDFLNMLIEAIPNPIFIKNKDGVYIRCNTAFADFIGKKKTEIEGRSMFETAPAELAETYGSQDKHFLESSKGRAFETKVLHADNTLRDVIVYKATFQGKADNEQSVIGVVVDITERKKMEDQLRRAQKLEAIGQLSAGIAHEINTPTQFIHTNAEFIKEAVDELLDVILRTEELFSSGAVKVEGKEQLIEIRALMADCIENLSEDVQDAISGTMEGVNRISAIVESMRYFSHPGAENKVRIDVNRAIEQAITVSKNEWKYNADVEVRLDPALPPLLGYSGPFNQALLNLIVNAAQAISQASETSPEQKGKITITTGMENGRIRISIKDSGTGIPEDVLPRIFDPFFTTKEVGKGTGQGLALVQSVIVEKHQGDIEVETELNKGTKFLLKIPVKDEEGEMENFQ